VARLTPDNIEVAREIIGRYPRARSALIPLCHLAQAQDGWLTEDAMAHLAELVGVTPAEVLGTASFYEMFKRSPVGRYQLNICTQISCMLDGADELLAHAAHRLGIHPGQTTPDGMFTLEGVECLVACTEAPCLQINYRYFHRVSPTELDQIIVDLPARGRTDVPTRSNDSGDIPPHGTLARVRQRLPRDGRAGNAMPEGAGEPAWFAADAGATGGH
jgi:NADH-quinone oxidoreductase subunit E